MIAYLIASFVIIYMFTAFVIAYLITSFVFIYLFTAFVIAYLITSFVITYLITSFVIAYLPNSNWIICDTRQILISIVIESLPFDSHHWFFYWSVAYVPKRKLINQQEIKPAPKLPVIFVSLQLNLIGLRHIYIFHLYLNS